MTVKEASRSLAAACSTPMPLHELQMYCRHLQHEGNGGETDSTEGDDVLGTGTHVWLDGAGGLSSC